MFYRDFMQKFRPLYSPDEPASAGAAVPAAGGEAVAAAAPAADGQASAAAPAGPSAEPAAAAAAPVAAEAAPAAEPSLLEAASGAKPVAEPDAAAPDAKDSPAPAEAATETKDAKPEAKADGDAPKDDKAAAETDPAKKEATAAEPPAPIKYDAFKVPDGIKLDDERIGKFTEVAGAGQVSQDVAQSLLDLHVAEMQRFSTEVQEQAAAHQREVWNKLQDTWKSEARKDEQIGGNRLETALARGKAVLEEYGGSADQVRELIAHTSNNGMGNFPGFLRFLDNIAQALNVFEDSAVGANPSAPKPGKGPGQRGWYPSMNGGQPPQP